MVSYFAITNVLMSLVVSNCGEKKVLSELETVVMYTP